MALLNPEDDLEGQFAAIWKEALAENAPKPGESSSGTSSNDKKSFGEHLGMKKKSKKPSAEDMMKPATVNDLLVEVQRQNDEFVEFRKKRHALFTVLEKALIPIELMCNMMAGAAVNVMPPSCFVFGSVLHLARSAHGVSENYDSICVLFDQIKEFTTRLSIYTRDKISSELRAVATRILVAVIKICALSSKLFHRGRVLHFLQAVFLEKDQAVAAEVKSLNSLVETEQRLVGALTLEVASRTANRVDESVIILRDTNDTVRQFRNEFREYFTVQTSNLAVSAGARPTTDEADAANLDKIKTVLQPSSTPEDIYRGIASARVPETGDWIRNEPLFKSWLNLDRPILWVSGGPGAGKSYLSSNIIQHLTELHPQGVNQEPRISVAYFFCKDYDPELRSFNKALRTLSYAICQNDPTYAKYVARFCSVPNDLNTTRKIWQKLFIEYFQREAHNFRSRVYIVVDGLDETPDEERRAFLELLRDFQDYSRGESKLMVQVVLVGRPDLNYIMDEILGEDIPMITVSASKNSEDINLYVRTRVARMPILRTASKAFQAEITSTMTEKAEGMFLWVDLMLRVIANKGSELQIRKALSAAPRGLNNTIRLVLERIGRDLDEDRIEDLNSLLSWVTCAQRPFTLDELKEIMKLRSEDGEGLIFLEGELRKRFASLFSLNREDGRSTEELQAERPAMGREEEPELPLYDDDTLVGSAGDFDGDLAYDTKIVSDPNTTEVTLAHASIGEYFRSGVGKNETAVGFDAQESQVQITKQLLVIVCDLSALVSDYWYNSSLGLYACDRWQEHLALIDISKTDPADKIAIGAFIMKIFHRRDMTRRWIAQASTFEVRWLYDEKVHILVHTWLKDPDVIASFSEPDRIWALSLGLKGNILDGAMQIAGYEWLRRHVWIACNLCYWMRAYVTAMECSKEGKPWPEEYDDLSKASAETIRKIARSAGFEEDATWHNRVGQVLQESGFHEEAIEEFEAALRAAPMSWQAHGGLALVYGDRCRWKEAVASAREAMLILTTNEELLASNKSIYEALMKKLALWESNSNEKERALDSYRRVLSIWPNDYTAVTEMLKILAAQKDYGEVIHLLEGLDVGISIGKGHSRLVDMCIASGSEDGESGHVYFCDGVTIAAREKSGLELLRNMYVSAIRASRKNLKSTTVLALQKELALLYYNGFEDDAKATSMWEAVISDSRYAKAGTHLHQVRSQAAMCLCKAYVGAALRGGKGSDAFKASVEKLELLSKPFRDGVLDFDWRRDDIFNSTFNSLQSLGLLYRLSGREAEARACFVPHMKLGFDLLGDEDESNDFQGFGKLAETLLHAGDNLNTLAAYSRFGLPDSFREEESDPDLVIVEKEDAQPESPGWQGSEEAGAGRLPVLPAASSAHGSEDEEPVSVSVSGLSLAEQGSPIAPISRQPSAASASSSASSLPARMPVHGIMECDGGCGKTCHRPDGLNLCRFCIDTCFCDGCLALLRRGEMALRVCDPRHDWLRIPDWGGGLADGEMWVGGERVQWRDWLEGLRLDWRV